MTLVLILGGGGNSTNKQRAVVFGGRVGDRWEGGGGQDQGLVGETSEARGYLNND